MLLKKQIMLFSIGLVSTATFASEHIIVAPQCLMKNSNIHYQTLATKNSLTLLRVNDAGIAQLSEAKHQQHATPCGGFMDVTADWHTSSVKSQNAKDFLAKYTSHTSSSKLTTYSIKYPDQVKQLTDQMNPQMMWNDLATLSAYKDRYAESDNGVNTANWLKAKVESIARANNRTDVSVYTVPCSYQQPSVVAKIGNGTGPGIVIGGHMDTTSSMWTNKPGADDDGTGTVTALEVARTILSSNMSFKKPIYVIFYAAEEEGLVGSNYVVQDFKKKKIPVDAVLHLDMTGYTYQNKPDMWLINDYVNKDLTSFTEKLIDTYVKQPVHYTSCGYACSDHASWTQGGFASAMPSESAFENMNHAIHTANDTMDKLSFNHMADYEKLALAFVVELAEPV